MKTSILVSALFAIVFGMAGCIKDVNNGGCTDKLVTSEAAAMQTYANANGITATAHPNGMLFQVMDPGAGPIPLPTSRVFVKYTGKLVSSNAVFDAQTDPSKTGWVLQTLIPGWQEGLVNIKKGGRIKLIVPSSLAYGCRGYASIPGDAVLFFDIELVDVQ